MEWSKSEKKIAYQAFDTSYKRECFAIAQEVRKMAEKINEPSDMWKIHDYLSEKEMKPIRSTISVIPSC